MLIASKGDLFHLIFCDSIEKVPIKRKLNILNNVLPRVL